MTQQSGNQFDDDLTVGMDDSDSFSSGSIDLFEFTGDEESPIARLKTIILSIDWEINDDILRQLDDELLDLGDIWAGDKIKQVYIQGLSKIGKYINKERAGAHPNSIKLLLTFYHNLEKIVSSDGDMTEEEKKKILLEDVKKFDTLKTQIGQLSAGAPAKKVAQETLKPEESITESEDVVKLKALNALILGLDWEINDRDLQSLSEEVRRLETTFSQSKVKLVLLQGIGALSSYINDMRSQSNAKAFTLLHSFYGALEKIAGSGLTGDEEKQLVLTEVSQFNAFKAEIAGDKTAPASASVQTASADTSPAKISEPSPAADFAESEEGGTSAIDSRLDSVFGDTTDQESDVDASEDDALEGVNVETEADDDSDEDALPYQDGSVAPALSDASEESGFSVEKLADDLGQAPETATEQVVEPATPAAFSEKGDEGVTDDVYGEELFPSEDEDLAPAFADVSDESSSSVENLVDDLFGTTESDEEDFAEPEVDISVQGVDVETEADDDSQEESLPVDKGELAPALTEADDDQGYAEESIAFDDEDAPSDDLEDRLGAFFDDEMEASSEEWRTEKESDVVAAESEDADTGLIAALSDVSEEDQKTVTAEETLSPAVTERLDDTLSSEDDAEETIEETAGDEDNVAEVTEEALSFLDDDEDDLAAIAEPAETGTEESEELVLTEESEIAIPEEIESEKEEHLVVDESTEDSIEFTVPGQVDLGAESDETAEKKFERDDSIEFDVPGDEFVSETALLSPEGEVLEEVVFEAVDDDVEVDPLPGEEYVDQLESEKLTDEKGVEFTEAADEPSVDLQKSLDKYVDLGAGIETLKGDITEENIQNLYSEVNRLRNAVTTGCTDKIFLQLLSTVSQGIEGSEEGSGPNRLALLDNILTGLEMDPTHIDRVQQQLLTCTSQVLLLHQKN